MSGVWEEIGAGREPQHDLPPSSPFRPRRPLSQAAREWARTHRAATVGLVVAAVLLGAGTRWLWQRTHVPPPTQALHVTLDPSEYLLAGRIDGKGQADVLLLLRVDVAPGFAQSVELLGMQGGGIAVTGPHVVTGGSAQFAIPARVSCDQWADGQGVRAQFRVGGPTGHVVEVPLDAGHNSPVHAEITAPCAVFAATHPLRLSVFSVTFQPTQPILETTWTLVNRSSTPLSLDPAGDTTIVGSSLLPLQVLAGGPGDGPTVVGARQSVSVTRRIAVTSCTNTADLDANGTSIRLVGAGTPRSAGDSGKAVVDLPDEFVQQLMNVSIDVCSGAPDPSGLRAALTFGPGPPGKGTAQLRVTGQIRLAGPWRARLVDQGLLHAPLDRAAGKSEQPGSGVSAVDVEQHWTIRLCTSVDLPDHGNLQALVTVTSIRAYPFLLPVRVSGQTDCTPGDIRS